MNLVVLWWMLGAIGLLGSALCSGLEVGMYSVNRVRLAVRSRVGQSASRIARLGRELDHRARVLTSLLIFNNLFNYLGTLAITALLTMRGFGDMTIIVLQAAILTPMILVFGEAIPKEISRIHADEMMPRFARVLVFMRVVLTWLLVLPMLLWIARRVARLIGVDPQAAVGSGRERMAELLKYGTGQLSDQQMTLIDRALVFEHATVGSEMASLDSATVVPIGWDRLRAAALASGKAMRWLPVVDADQKVVGMISVLDLHRSGEATIAELMTDSVRVDAGAPVRAGLEALRAAGSSVAVVVQGGQDVGIVTIKDLVGPLLGSK